MPFSANRSVLDNEISQLKNDILRISSMVDENIDKAINALKTRDIPLAQEIIESDSEVNNLRFEIEKACMLILATQAPAATDLRIVIATMHLADELERIGDHAVGIARLVEMMQTEEAIDSLHKLPKMAKRARQMLQEGIQAYVQADTSQAEALLRYEDKLDKQYKKLVVESMEEMQDESYILRATYLIWAAHSLERIGDRAVNIAERVIFMTTGKYVEYVEGTSELEIYPTRPPKQTSDHINGSLQAKIMQ